MRSKRRPSTSASRASTPSSSSRTSKPPQISHWGKRTLAYPIKKHETGYYVVAKFDADATALPEFERAIKLDEGVLRFLVVVNEGAQPVPVTAGKSDEEDDE